MSKQICHHHTSTNFHPNITLIRNKTFRFLQFLMSNLPSLILNKISINSSRPRLSTTTTVMPITTGRLGNSTAYTSGDNR